MDIEHLCTEVDSIYRFSNQVNWGDSLSYQFDFAHNIGVDIPGSQFHYFWYKDSMVIDSLSDSDSLKVTQIGLCTVHITRDSIPDLTIVSNPINIYDLFTVSSGVNEHWINGTSFVIPNIPLEQMEDPANSKKYQIYWVNH